MPTALDPLEPRLDEDRVRWAADVRDALAALCGDERAFILASYFDGQLHASIAQRAGLPVTAVSLTIANGMRRLALILEAAPPSPAG